MDLKKYTRNSSKVHESLVSNEDGSLVTTRACKIYIPERFTERQLAFLGTETFIVGFFAICYPDDGYYGVSKAPAMMRIEPDSTDIVMVNGAPYLEFTFSAGAVITGNYNLVKNDTMVYLIYDEIISKGHVPAYMDYEDTVTMFDLSGYHAGLDVGGNHAIMETFAAFISRDPADRTKYYRQTIRNRSELKTRPPVAVPFRSVTFGATNTAAKIMGNHFDEGLTSALNNPSEKVESIERLLRT